MPQRRNENASMIRQEPFAYICEYDASGSPEYEAWAEVGADTASLVWIACKHTYNATNQLTRTQWAQDSSGKVGYFSVAANALSSLTYV